jgi:hypothetical protein
MLFCDTVSMLMLCGIVVCLLKQILMMWFMFSLWRFFALFLWYGIRVLMLMVDVVFDDNLDYVVREFDFLE